MAFSPSRKEASDFNGGERYRNHIDSPSAEDFNNVIEGLLKCQEDIDDNASMIEYVNGRVVDLDYSIIDINQNVPKINERLSLTEKRVDNLYARAFPEIDVIDNAVAYSKTVPEGALPYAEVAKVGGMSHAVDGKLVHAKVTAVKSIGVNLIPYPYFETTITRNGVTFTDNGDGSITINGTTTESTPFTFGTFQVVPKQEYFFKVIPISGGWGSIYAYVYTDSADEVYDLGDGTKFTPNGNTASSSMVLGAGQTFNNLVVKPMLNIGDTALPYRPYTESTLPIPSAVQALPDYGLGVSTTGNNHVDWSERKYHKTCGEVDLGLFDWLFGGYYAYPNVANNFAKPEGACVANVPNDITSYNINGSGIPVFIFPEGAYANADAVKAAMQGVTLVYELATPDEPTDISHLIPEDNFIPVEAGGQIVAENEDKLGAPTTINYQIN